MSRGRRRRTWKVIREIANKCNDMGFAKKAGCEAVCWSTCLLAGDRTRWSLQKLLPSCLPEIARTEELLAGERRWPRPVASSEPVIGGQWITPGAEPRN
ncbi:hypothetical protein SETIT_1G024800v2 [Setaria italica]|uniref:Uncharacterized protein n=1 Tax=Setaria italica TaxID=4555 RepID=A0A368PG31_SETIT|nr:hypothetical protein SETIT_1G024800v2 [Setaria italica]